MGAGLIDDFIRNILSVPFCPCHFVHTILSNAILSVYHFVHTILSVPFCPYHFVRSHFVLEPVRLYSRSTRPRPCERTNDVPIIMNCVGTSRNHARLLFVGV